MDRERYHGADIAHLLHACSQTLDWPRLLWRFNPHWRVLLSHLILFGYVYPGRRLQVPRWLMSELIRRLEVQMTSMPSDRMMCQGTLLSWAQYLDCIERGEYEDARHPPRGALTVEETAFVTTQFRNEQDIGSDTTNLSRKRSQLRPQPGQETQLHKSAA